MINLLLLLIFNALYINGFYNLSNQDMPLAFLQKIPDKLDFIKKPLCDCLPCMASLHSWPYFVMNKNSSDMLLIYPVYICALSFLNLFVYEFFEHKKSF